MADVPDAVVFDAFALATAARTDATLLVGADDDYDDVADVPVVRFRTDSA